ncbi:MAG: GrpB family protein [Actinomycetota bacterium]
MHSVRDITVGQPTRVDGPIHLSPADPRWPAVFAEEGRHLRKALGTRALRIEHVGSTSVPGLAAKPIIDVLVAVEDSSVEPAYVPPLEAAGYVLRIREPDWYEHRVLKGPAKGPALDSNVHVFSEGCEEIERMLRFRDRLRSDADDRELYEQAKRELAARRWTYVQDYADAKSAVVERILRRVPTAPPTTLRRKD